MRSGGALGADTAFEEGCIEAKGKFEIYLPWSKFDNRPNVNQGEWKDSYYCISDTKDNWAFELAAEKGASCLEHWNNGRSSVKRLWARNMLQILGENGIQKSKLVIYWAPLHDLEGTGWAIRAAKKLILNVSIYRIMKFKKGLKGI